MDSLGKRLRSERLKLGLSQTEFGEKLGITKRSQMLYEGGQRLPRADYLVGIAEMGIDVLFVLTGRGTKDNQDAVAGTQDCATVPLYDIEAAAGDGALFDNETIISHLPFDPAWLSEQAASVSQLVALTVVGDSMADTLNSGDIVLVDRSKTRPDGVFLVRVGDALRIKRVQQMAGGALSLVSDNNRYQPELVPPERLGEVEVLGQVLGSLGRVI
ncbi:XRE family transcriptional regulator [Larsenimonas suaedae]|uniref:XRE family transcriptional regulator n=1 Tax=Larsenimonas suaedae TaxID=1851019 RepID=A0ABU1GZ75_9GAMM|nr:XRE family transcriptional regulator [Larsenimonas suaedae]MCM2973478.1 XRE family transcriptional regulator [Larsenimonas suaedae]MDR5897346.1 XRE family transcriptional regulator [Larsenimonas suaedae]